MIKQLTQNLGLFFISLCLLEGTAVGADFEREPQYSILAQGPHERTWQRIVQEQLPNGRIVSRKSGFTEMAVGLNYLKDGQWTESKELIELFQDGAVARQGQIQVIWAPNLATPGAVDLLTPDGKRFQTHVLGLAIHDLASGQNELIAEVKDCLGELHPPNQVLYPDAFTDVKATVRYTLNRDRFEQDIILFERLTLPVGYDPSSTVLEIWTEAIDPPDPEISARQIDNRTDEFLAFGAMGIGAGRAFQLEDPQGRAWSVPVTKKWTTVEGRTFLIESIGYQAIKPQLDQLPRPRQGAAIGDPAAGAARRHMAINATGQRYFPARKQTAKAGGKVKVVETASVPVPAGGNTAGKTEVASTRGLVVDYSLVTSMANITFKGGETYFISGNCTFTGSSNYLEGTAVLKITNGASITINGTLECLTGPFRPGILTSWCDNTVGETITGSTGNPATNYAGTALSFPVYLSGVAANLSHLRISYADTGISYDRGITNLARHIQFVHCATAIKSYGSISDSRNILAYDCAKVFDSSPSSPGATCRVEHATFNVVGTLNNNSYCTLFFTNCLLVAVTNTSSYTGANNASNSDPAAVFQTVGAGAHYLLNNTYRNFGTTNITADLQADLRERTTYPPIVFSNTIISTYTALNPQAQRDNDTPDLGYHYAPLDFVFGKVTLTNITMSIAPGTAIGLFAPAGTNALQFVGGQIVCQGTASAMNRIARYNGVQEQANANWVGAGDSIITAFSGTPPAATARFHFTEFSNPAGSGSLFNDLAFQQTTYSIAHCRLYGGLLYDYLASSYFTNNLFHRCTILAEDIGYSFSFLVRNCLFYGGIVNVTGDGSGNWSFKDNLFDKVVIYPSGVTADYNGYTTNSAVLDATATHDKRLAITNIGYQIWGAETFYLPTNSLLINAGSTFAANVGLYHFTVTTNQVKEAGTTNDIGWHYVAVTNGVPIDTDADGLADYVEDVNGNGSLDSGETNPSSASDWGLKVYITRPRKGNIIP